MKITKLLLSGHVFISREKFPEKRDSQKGTIERVFYMRTTFFKKMQQELLQNSNPIYQRALFAPPDRLYPQ